MCKALTSSDWVFVPFHEVVSNEIVFHLHTVLLIGLKTHHWCGVLLGLAFLLFSESWQRFFHHVFLIRFDMSTSLLPSHLAP
jgi:hypothetical protein